MEDETHRLPPDRLSHRFQADGGGGIRVDFRVPVKSLGESFVFVRPDRWQ